MQKMLSEARLHLEAAELKSFVTAIARAGKQSDRPTEMYLSPQKTKST